MRTLRKLMLGCYHFFEGSFVQAIELLVHTLVVASVLIGIPLIGMSKYFISSSF